MPPKLPKSPGKQRTIASFFSPGKRAAEVIEVSDSDDEVVVVEKKPRLENGVDKGMIVAGAGDTLLTVEKVETEEKESDEALAHRLAAEWEAEDVHGSEKKLEPVSPTKKLHPMFARTQDAGPSQPQEVKPVSAVTTTPKSKEERKPTLTAARAQPVDPIDFDVDALLFRPAAVDISRWPGGRLPYSVLVGVYVQVAGTRSRLAIVRVLTKYACARLI
ncbi:unnamed protein product [Cutaneotrichosporon oleaginosum]